MGGLLNDDVESGISRGVACGPRDARAAMSMRARLGAAPRAARNWGLVRPLLPAWPQRGADCHSAAVSAAVPQQFRSCSAAVPQQFRSCSAAAPQQLRSSSAAAPQQLRSRSVLPQSFRVTSAVVPCSLRTASAVAQTKRPNARITIAIGWVRTRWKVVRCVHNGRERESRGANPATGA